MVLCEVSVYERVFKFIEFNLWRIELMHIGTALIILLVSSLERLWAKTGRA